MEVMEKLATFKVKCRDLYGDAFSYIIVVTFLYILWISNLIDKIFNTQGVYTTMSIDTCDTVLAAYKYMTTTCILLTKLVFVAFDIFISYNIIFIIYILTKSVTKRG